tara:strand:+ start:182 stop:421 length:240 start_codon:yes stop_codon:yes gene_type:complete
MKRKELKNIIKKELLKLEEQQTLTSFKASDNDPSTSCAGRGICCIDSEGKNVPAKFILYPTNRVECICPPKTGRKFCER